MLRYLVDYSRRLPTYRHPQNMAVSGSESVP